MSRESSLVALDLSLTNLGMVACAPSWDGEWSRVRFTTWTSKPRSHFVSRVDALASAVVRFCRDANASEVWAEDLASSQGYSVVALAELRFGVRRALFRELGLDLGFVGEVVARKLLLGWFPRDRKAAVSEVLKAAGDRFDDDHQRDAFAVVNWRLHELGGYSFSGLLGEKPIKPKTSRRRKPKNQTAGFMEIIAGGGA